MYEDFPQENFDDDLNELDGTMREESQESYGDEEDGAEDPLADDQAQLGEEEEQPSMEQNNELSELQGLDGGSMMAAADDSLQKEYVEPSAHDMRRSRQVNAAMVDKLVKQEEEIKVEKQKRLSRPDAKHR